LTLWKRFGPSDWAGYLAWGREGCSIGEHHASAYREAWPCLNIAHPRIVKVKSIRLVAAASTHRRLIGPPSGRWCTPPFSVREKLDGDGIVWRPSPEVPGL
jgi:hypothetical protein